MRAVLSLPSVVLGLRHETPRNGEVEGIASLWLAFHPHLPLMQPNQLLDYREAEPWRGTLPRE
jgi:hypothetical protein